MTNTLSPGEAREELSDSVSSKIVQRVATLTEQDVIQLPPLYDTIDPDALDRLVQSTETGKTILSIQFTYAEHQVTVEPNGTVSCSQKIDVVQLS